MFVASAYACIGNEGWVLGLKVMEMVKIMIFDESSPVKTTRQRDSFNWNLNFRECYTLLIPNQPLMDITKKAKSVGISSLLLVLCNYMFRPWSNPKKKYHSFLTGCVEVPFFRASNKWNSRIHAQGIMAAKWQKMDGENLAKKKLHVTFTSWKRGQLLNATKCREPFQFVMTTLKYTDSLKRGN